MKKIILALLISFTLLFASGRATWTVDFYDANFQKVWSESVNVVYNGQSITLSLVESVTATETEIIYTGIDSVRGVQKYLGITGKPVFNSSTVYVKINFPLSLTLE